MIVPAAMWSCPDCGRSFANRNQSHACAPLGNLDQHFAHAAPGVRAAFDRVLAAVSAFGPVEVLPEKTRIALHIRSFAAFVPRRRWLNGHLVLARHIDSPRFLRIQELKLPPRNVAVEPCRQAQWPADQAMILTCADDPDDLAVRGYCL